MRRGARGGFTLLELVFAMTLGCAVPVALADLCVPLARAQARAARGQTVQLGLEEGLSAVHRELAQATLVPVPSWAGAPSESLEGCGNAAVPPGGAAPTPARAWTSRRAPAPPATRRWPWGRA